MSIRLKEIAQSFAGKRILVIGDAMLDCYIQGVSGRLCQEAPVPVVEHCRQLDFAGGAANAAANAASLAGESALVSVIGSDAQGERLRQLLAIAGVETTGMRASPARQTLTKQRVMCGTQMIVRFDSGTTAELDAEEQRCILASLDREFVRCDGVIVSDYGGAVLTPQIIQRLMRLNARHPRIVAIDSRRLRRFREIEPALIKPNYREAAAILDLPPAEGRGRIELVRNHARRLLTLTGARMASVTLDCDGAVLIEENGDSHHLPAQPVSELLTSGAGDSFLTAMTLALASGASLVEAGQIAAATASIVTRTNFKRTCLVDELHAALSHVDAAGDSRQLADLLRWARDAGRKVVLTNGCFDILHRGHIAYLNQARRLGDLLIVGVNSDESIRRLKGPERPVNALEDRIEVLSGLAGVDHVVAFSEDTPHRLIEIVRPDVFVKGGDYTLETLPEAGLVEKLGGRVVILPYLADRSTSTLIERIRHSAYRQKVPVKEGECHASAAVERRHEPLVR